MRDSIKMDSLIENIDKLHTTELGVERIKKNLQIETDDVVQWCKIQVQNKKAKIQRLGKNWYVTVGDCKITVNAHSYTIITAHHIILSNFKLDYDTLKYKK